MTDNTMHEEIAARLEGKLTAAECGGLLIQVQNALTDLEIAMAPLHPGDMSHHRGKERDRILLSGTPEDLLNLRDAFDVMQARRDQLRAQADELHRRRKAAAEQEAFHGLPALHDTLRSRIDAAEKAQRALEAAFDELEAAYLDIRQARATCHAGGLSPAGTTPETIDRLAQLTPFSAKRRHFAQHDPGLHRDTLGIEPAAEGRAAA
ncbi:MAG: hypothetical protein J0H15_04975 [Xanthomonadales bacterium]|nr:hypothetical protein [Xanthomonadales bacterium]